MVEQREYDQAKQLGKLSGRHGDAKDSCPFKGPSLHEQRAAWLAGYEEGKAERKARATR